MSFVIRGFDSNQDDCRMSIYPINVQNEFLYFSISVSVPYFAGKMDGAILIDSFLGFIRDAEAVRNGSQDRAELTNYEGVTVSIRMLDQMPLISITVVLDPVIGYSNEKEVLIVTEPHMRAPAKLECCFWTDSVHLGNSLSSALAEIATFCDQQ